MVISFFGHSDYLGNTNDVKRMLALLECVVKDNKVDFYLGGYGRFDSFALKCAKIYKEIHPASKLIFVSPYIDKWLDQRKSILAETYDEIVYPELEHVPQRFAISKRNEWIVNQSDYIFCYVRTHFGGAYNALLYAKRHNKPYYNLFQGDYELY